MRGHIPSSFVLSAVASLALLGCGIDDRELQLMSGGSGGTTSGSAGTGNGGARAGSGGGPSGLDAPPPPVCNYAPSGADAGCESLVDNPGFAKDTGVEGWPGANVLIHTQWEKSDATGIKGSGAMAVDNLFWADEAGQTLNGALQCVPAEPSAVYDVLADVLIPKQEDEGRAGINVLFYKTTDCNASNVGTDQSFTTDLVDEVGVWQPVGGRFVVPSGMHSMEITLLSAKSFRAKSFTALFDNVLVQKK
jgi:hypothetical protein